MNCKAVCLQIEDADRSWQPDGVVQQHLESCEECRAFQEEQMKLRQLVKSLGTVQAPADFDFRLRARLAKQSNAGRFWIGGASFGWPSAAVATLVLIVGAVFVLRNTSEPQIPVTTVVTTASEPAPPDAITTSSPEDNFKPANQAPPVPQSARSKPAVTRDRPQFASTQRRPLGRRLASKEYSSVAAKVVKPEDTVASADPVFTIYGSDEPMRVSLDDGSGVQRTISLPRISFGSQRAFATEQTSMVKTSAKGVW